ncbi:recombinase RecT [Aquimarina algiphila]|nr:recombinase RecT [Aquimarina algiphila]
MQDSIQDQFKSILGEKAQSYISSALQVVNSDKYLSSADPQTVLHAVATAAILDLPINPSLGFAWVVAYKGKAQFQVGWKGFVQLAIRSGQYKKLNVTEVYENQFTAHNALTEEIVANFNLVGKGEVVGYAAYFRLHNGMEKTVFWSKQKVIDHAKKYSTSYGDKNSPWTKQFDAMAKKTVIKNTISKWGIMSVQMQTAHLADQAVQEEEGSYRYVDNEPVESAPKEIKEPEIVFLTEEQFNKAMKSTPQGIKATLTRYGTKYKTMSPEHKTALQNQLQEIEG